MMTGNDTMTTKPPKALRSDRDKLVAEIEALKAEHRETKASILRQCWELERRATKAAERCRAGLLALRDLERGDPRRAQRFVDQMDAEAAQRAAENPTRRRGRPPRPRTSPPQIG